MLEVLHTCNLFKDEGNESSLKYENVCIFFLDRPSYKYLIKYIPPPPFFCIHIHLGDNSLMRKKWWPRSLGVYFQWIVIIISDELRNRRSSPAYPHFTTMFKITLIKVCVHISSDRSLGKRMIPGKAQTKIITHMPFTLSFSNAFESELKIFKWSCWLKLVLSSLL